MAITWGTHYIGLTVPDYEAAQDFVVDVLGLDRLAGATPFLD